MICIDIPVRDSPHRRPCYSSLLQGFCLEPPTGSMASILEDLDIGNIQKEPWRAPRCVVLTSETPFIVDRSRLWLDSLHVQMLEGSTEKHPASFWSLDAGRVYVTNCAAQGDRSEAMLAMEVARSVKGAYVQGMLPMCAQRGTGDIMHDPPSAAAPIYMFARTSIVN